MRTGLGRCRRPVPARCSASQSRVSVMTIPAPLVPTPTWVHGPMVSATSTPRRRSRSYCPIIWSGNRSCQPSCNKTGTLTRSSACPSRMGRHSGSSASGVESHARYGVRLPARTVSCARARGSSSNPGFRRRAAVTHRRIPLATPPPKCPKASMRPSVSSSEKAPAPCAAQWLSCGETAITAATSSGGGSIITAHAVYPT